MPLNLADAEGNFFLKPNEVFYLEDVTGPGIVKAGAYSPLTIKPRLANQSGPLILQKGVIHPVFNANSPNLRQSSAVAVVTKTKEIIFVMNDREDRVKGSCHLSSARALVSASEL